MHPFLEKATALLFQKGDSSSTENIAGTAKIIVLLNKFHEF